MLWLLLACAGGPTSEDSHAHDSGCACPDDTGTATDSGGAPDSGDPTETGDTAAPHEPTPLVGSDAQATLLADGGLGSRGAFVGAGDVDGDGFGDLWVGVPTASISDSVGVGAAWLVHGPVTGDVTQDDAATLIYGLGTGDQLGLRVGSRGDLTGDGRGDLWVSAPQASDGLGAVYVFDGADLGAGSVSADAADATILGDGFAGGQRSAGHGDVNGDGVDDLLVTSVHVAGGEAAPWWLFAGPLSGPSNVEDGEAVRTVLVSDDGYDNPYEAGLVEELSGDGYAEVVLADHQSSLSAGRLQVYEGEAAGVGRTLAMVYGARADDALGAAGALDGVGDLDGDGFGDLIVGAAAADGVGEDSGAAWVLYGPLSGVYSLSAHGERLDGTAAGQGAGRWVAGAGDTDGDGLDDLFVGGDGVGWLLQGPVVAGPLTDAAWRLDESAGYGAGVGDVDGDGRADVASLSADLAGLHVFTGL